MTNEELKKAIELAEESVEGFADDDSFEMTLAKAVLELQDRLKKEREACAKVCEEQMQGKSIWIEGARACSLAIRSRGQE